MTQPDRYLDLVETQVIIPDDDVEDPFTYKLVLSDISKEVTDQSNES